jgi:hypothetical protein
MKNNKLFTLLVIVMLSTLALTACDGTIPEGLNLEEYLQDSTSLNAVSADDTTVDVLGRSSDDSKGNSSSNDDSMNDNSSSDDYDIEVKAEVTAVTANTITFNGETFTVDTTEDLTTMFLAGDFFEFKYLVNQDGSITIVEFHQEDSLDDNSSSDDYDIELKTEVTAVTANTITFNGETFTVDTTEDLTSLVTAGDFIEIKYLVNDDGSITIVEFEQEDSLDDSSDDDMYDDDDSMDDSDDDDHYDDNYDDDHDDNDDDNNSNDDNNNDDDELDND